MHAIFDVLEGFWTYQTPVSFLAGVGVYHLYCRATHGRIWVKLDDERSSGVQEER